MISELEEIILILGLGKIEQKLIFIALFHKKDVGFLLIGAQNVIRRILQGNGTIRVLREHLMFVILVFREE